MYLAKRLYWFTRLFIRCGGWVALIPLLIGLTSTLGAISLTRNANLLAQNGVPATATVIAKRIEQGSHTATQERQRPADSFFVTLTFAPQNAAQISAEHQVHATFYRSHDIGQTLQIRYLPGNPDIRELYDGELFVWSNSTQIVGLGFAAIGLTACIWFATTALRALRARENPSMIVDAPVTHRALWPPLFNRMHYQVGQGKDARVHKTFIRPMWVYRGLRRGGNTRVALTDQGPYWANDLFL